MKDQETPDERYEQLFGYRPLNRVRSIFMANGAYSHLYRYRHDLCQDVFSVFLNNPTNVVKNWVKAIVEEEVGVRTRSSI